MRTASVKAVTANCVIRHQDDAMIGSNMNHLGSAVESMRREDLLSSNGRHVHNGTILALIHALDDLISEGSCES